MTKFYESIDPSINFSSSFYDLMNYGEELSPRGKRIKELRPVVIVNPLSLPFIFIPTRRNNPFFSVFESSFWIMSGRSDVESLAFFNSNMTQFSDDGSTFNAPYGERLRKWGQNSYRGIYPIDTIDQLEDCYKKVSKDPDTRQAIALISNPEFDNSEYTLSGGKDIACNTTLSFKLRNNKLCLTVFNRSNDIVYGVFGANITQFTTINRIMAGWLGCEVGEYNQITDSLHVYLEDYASKLNNPLMRAITEFSQQTLPYIKENQPKLSFEETQKLLDKFWSHDLWQLQLGNEVDTPADSYWKTCYAMIRAYCLYKLGRYEDVKAVVVEMEESSEKLAAVLWLSGSKIKKQPELVEAMILSLSDDCSTYIRKLIEIEESVTNGYNR